MILRPEEKHTNSNGPSLNLESTRDLTSTSYNSKRRGTNTRIEMKEESRFRQTFRIFTSAKGLKVRHHAARNKFHPALWNKIHRSMPASGLLNPSHRFYIIVVWTQAKKSSVYHC